MADLFLSHELWLATKAEDGELLVVVVLLEDRADLADRCLVVIRGTFADRVQTAFHVGVHIRSSVVDRDG